MEEQNRQKTRAAQLKKNLDEISKHGRLNVTGTFLNSLFLFGIPFLNSGSSLLKKYLPDRVNHIRKLQKVDGVEIYAIQ